MGYASQIYRYKVDAGFTRHVLTDLRLTLESRAILVYCVNSDTIFNQYILSNVAKSLGFSTKELINYLSSKDLSRYFVGNYSEAKQKINPNFATLSDDYPEYVTATPMTTAYYIEINHKGKKLYKIGITCSSVENRFREDNIDFKVLDVEHFDSRETAYAYEQLILDKYSKYRYKGEPILKGGNTEIFTEDVLGFSPESKILENRLIEAMQKNTPLYPQGLPSVAIKGSLGFDVDKVSVVDLILDRLVKQSRLSINNFDDSKTNYYLLPIVREDVPPKNPYIEHCLEPNYSIKAQVKNK